MSLIGRPKKGFNVIAYNAQKARKMSRTKDLWQEQHEAAINRFVSGEDDAVLFATILRKLGFDSHDIQQEINNAMSERAELAAYEAAVAYYERMRS